MTNTKITEGATVWSVSDMDCAADERDIGRVAMLDREGNALVVWRDEGARRWESTYDLIRC